MFGRSNSIKLDPVLYARIIRVAKAAGYSSPKEFIEHVIEKELAQIEDGASDEEILDRLKGLGYID